jgi:hypothetical protein
MATVKDPIRLQIETQPLSPGNTSPGNTSSSNTSSGNPSSGNPSSGNPSSGHRHTTAGGGGGRRGTLGGPTNSSGGWGGTLLILGAVFSFIYLFDVKAELFPLLLGGIIATFIGVGIIVYGLRKRLSATVTWTPRRT